MKQVTILMKNPANSDPRSSDGFIR